MCSRNLGEASLQDSELFVDGINASLPLNFLECSNRSASASAFVNPALGPMISNPDISTLVTPEAINIQVLLLLIYGPWKSFNQISPVSLTYIGYILQSLATRLFLLKLLIRSLLSIYEHHAATQKNLVGARKALP